MGPLACNLVYYVVSLIHRIAPLLAIETREKQQDLAAVELRVTRPKFSAQTDKTITGRNGNNHGAGLYVAIDCLDALLLTGEVDQGGVPQIRRWIQLQMTTSSAPAGDSPYPSG